jgi:hypothetical protein
MDRRLTGIGFLGCVEARPSQEWSPYLRACVGALLLVVHLAAVQTGLKADDPKAGATVNVRWRFDGGGRFPNIHPPSQWRRDKNILWQTPVEIGGYSSPIVVRDRVLLTAEMGSLVCLDLNDGKILWQKDLQQGQQRHPGRPVQTTDAGLRRGQQAIDAHAHQQRRTRVLHQRHGAVRLLRSPG